MPSNGLRLGRALDGGVIVALIAFGIYWLAARTYDAQRGDFFFLADAFLNGRTWIESWPAVYDVIRIGERVYVPFAPFPALFLAPLVAVVGPTLADSWESGINAAIAATGVLLAWTLLARLGVRRPLDRIWLVILFGFSTQVVWVATRGGVWHTGHLIAAMLTLAALIEIWGQRRVWLVGLLIGAAFLTRPPLAMAGPFFLLLTSDARLLQRGTAAAGGLVIRPTVEFMLGVAPSLAFFLWYNVARFGSPLESGYQLASVPPFLEAQRQMGLFSLAHVPMNLDYLFWHLPAFSASFPFLTPDGLGMSIFLTSPGLLLATGAPWREDRRTWLLLGAAIAVLIPTLLYYGGGYLQYGYRYALDSIPFVFALAGMAAARGRISPAWKLLIAFGVLVMAIGIYWAHAL